MSPMTVRLFACAAAAVLAGVVVGCSAPRVNTTMLTAADVVRMTDDMSADLAAAPFLAERSPDSPLWVWSMDRVTNLTEHIMPEGERWAVMARFRAKLSESLLARERNIRFVLPPEQWKKYASGSWQPEAERLRPTHALRAEFRSDTVTSLHARSDHYLCAFQLLDLESGRLLWEDAYEVKYAVSRNRFD